MKRLLAHSSRWVRFSILFTCILVPILQPTLTMAGSLAVAETFQMSYPSGQVDGSAKQIYKSKVFGHSIEVPGKAEIAVWKSTDSILEGVGIFLNEKQEDTHLTEFALSVFSNPDKLGISTWVEQNSKRAEGSLWARFDDVQSIKYHNDGFISFSHSQFGEYVDRVIILNQQGNILSFSHSNTSSKWAQSQYIDMLKSLKIDGENIVTKDINYADLFTSIQKGNSIDSEPLSSQGVMALTSIVSYKLPWSAGSAYSVGQTWGGAASHPCPGMQCYAYDFSTPEGTTLKAAGVGTVAYVKGDSSADTCGGQDYSNLANYVAINHDDGTTTFYLHLKSVSVNIGNIIQQGQNIGESGKTGYTAITPGYCAPHLHFQRGAQFTNPWASQSQAIYFDEYPGLQLAVGMSYTSQNSGTGPTLGRVEQVSGDYNGDGWDDLAMFDPGNGHWYIRLSNNAPVSTSSANDRDVQFGWATVIPVGSFDYDGDGRHDLTIFEPSTGRWYIRPSYGVTLGYPTGTLDKNIVFGWSTTIPLGGGKYDTDAMSELTVFDKATGHWHIRPTNNVPGGNPSGANDKNIIFGWATTIPLPGGDHDHDGRTDLAMYDTATNRWWVRPSMNVTTGYSSGAYDWNVVYGWASTVPKGGGDYNNDGWTDMTIFDTITARWYVRLSGGGNIDMGFGWGNVIPLGGGDYDKDGRTDLTFFYPGNGHWYIRRSNWTSGGGNPNGSNDLDIPFGWATVVPF